MIHFEQPYKGQHKETHFHLIVIVIRQDRKALCITEEGDLEWYDTSEINVDWRWSREHNNFISIDNPVLDRD